MVVVSHGIVFPSESMSGLSGSHGGGVVVVGGSVSHGLPFSVTHGRGVVVQGSHPGMVESSFGPHGRGVVVAVDVSVGVVVVSQPCPVASATHGGVLIRPGLGVEGLGLIFHGLVVWV